MLQPSREDNSSTISPNLLKNFNVYEILEPQRCNNETNVDTLIDFSDDSNNSTLNPDINASFVDKTKEYELIDVFQNMFVTPQQIKAKETKSDQCEHPNIDYSEFFDKLESGEKISWSDTQEEKEDKPSSSKYTDLNHNFNIKAKVLVPTIDLGPDSDQEDSLEQQKGLTDQEEDLIHELIASKNIESQILSQIYNVQPSTSELQNNTKSLKKSIELTNAEVDSENTKEDNRLTELSEHPHLNSQINNNFNDTFIVKAMVKDEKAYRKNRIVKTDREKLNYTKGPEFKEKQIVLPQIMRRLSEREKALNEQRLWKKRLILDTGTPSTDSCSKTVDSSRMNSTSNASSKSMTINTLFQAKPTKHSLYTATVSNLSADISKSLDNSNNSTISIGAKSFLASTKSAKTTSPSTSSKISLKSNAVPKSVSLYTPSETSAANSAISRGTGASSSDDSPLGTLRPVVLMEDCNKERLLAWRRSKMISNLVRTGKFNP